MEEVVAAALAKKEAWDAYNELCDELYKFSAEIYLIRSRIYKLEKKLDKKTERLSVLPNSSLLFRGKRKDRLEKRINTISKEMRYLQKKTKKLDNKRKTLYKQIRESAAEFQIANNKYEKARGDMLSGQ